LESPISVSAPLTVDPALLSVTASNQMRIYNTANPTLTYAITGFVLSDTESNSITGTPDLSTPAVLASPVGAYPINVAIGSLNASNYTFALNNGELTVTPGTPVITWAPLGPIVYGTPYGTNQLNAIADVPGTTNYFPGLGTITNAGSNTLTAVFTPTDTNYASITTSVPFLILKAPLTVTADNQSAPVGGPFPPLTVSYSGFFSNETAAVLDTPPTATTTATTNSPTGLYPITPGGGADDNYTFTYVDGTLTLGTVAPTLTVLRQINGFTTFNPQTSLFEQIVLVDNTTTATFTALRLVVSGLPATVQLYNAHGTNGAGNPYVDLVGPLTPGGSVAVLLEYWSEGRQPFTPPTVTLQVLSFLPPNPPLPGTVTAIGNSYMSAYGRFYLEWNSEVGKTYYVQYADSPSGPWKTVLSPVAGTGFRVVWIDDGPPKTESPGGGGRYYRLIVQ
jgi:MBG domain (YGX type)